MNPQDIKYLQESYLDIYENVKPSGSKTARRGRVKQRVTASQAAEIRAAAQRTQEPIPEPKPRQKRLGIGVLPSSGVGPEDKVLRGGYGRTPKGIASRRATELLKQSRDLSIPISSAIALMKRADKIKAALKNKKKWGTPEARMEEFILEYLIQSGYANCLGSAEIILENMSDEWFDTILEANWGKQPAPIDKMQKREEYYSKPGTMFKRWQDLDKPERIRRVREKMSR